MALQVVSSAAPHSFHSSTDISSSPDPFWAAPRSLQLSEKAMFASFRAALPPPPTQAPTKQQPKLGIQAHKSRPQCTHITMERLHGDYACHWCGKQPSLGWLYVCRQDYLPEGHDSPVEPTELDALGSESKSDITSLVRRAKEIKVTTYIISRIVAGDYTTDQVRKLVKQKEHLIEVIKQAQTTKSPMTPPASPKIRENKTPIIASVRVTGPVQSAGADGIFLAPVGISTNTPAKSTATTPSKSSRNASVERQSPKCQFKVCHRCRPFFCDRLYLSVEQILAGEMPAVTEKEITQQLPFRDPETVRNLGLRKQPTLPKLRTEGSKESVDITIQDQYDSGESSDDWTPSTDGSEKEEGGSNRNASWNSLVVHNGLDGFDDMHMSEPGLHEKALKAHSLYRTHQRISPTGTSSTASSISLPTPVSLGMTPIRVGEEPFELGMVNRSPKAATHCGALTPDTPRRSQRVGGKDSKDSFGSEVEVKGGVALTEEAVENQTPDLIMSK